MSDAEILEAQLGEDAKTFLRSDLGKLFAARAQADADQAISMLAELNPYEFTDLVELQNAIADAQRNMQVAGSITQYLQDAMTNGELAWQNLNTREEM